MNYKIKLNILYTILFLFSCETKENVGINESIVLSSFEKIDSSISNIDFINKITPNLENKANLFDYDYFYNGSGVGIADFNLSLIHISEPTRPY